MCTNEKQIFTKKINRNRKTAQHNRLLKFVENSDTSNVGRLLNPSILNVKFGRPYHKTIVPIVRFNLLQKAQWRMVDTIIEGGCEIFEKSNNREELLFFAGASGHFEKLLEVVEYFKRVNPSVLNNTREGDTPLMFLIKYGNASRESFVKCASILIGEAHVDVNTPDYYKCTVILRLGYLYGQNLDNQDILRNIKEVIRIILNEHTVVDVDSHKWHGKSARQYITHHGIFDVTKHLTLPFSDVSVDTKTNLFHAIIDRNEKLFKSIKNVDDYNLDNGQDTLLQLACKFNLLKTLKFLLSHGADPNLTTRRNCDSLLEISAKMNNCEMFHAILMHEKTTISKATYSFFALYKGNKIKTKYFGALLKSTKLDVNYVCHRGNTPLHHSILMSQKDTTIGLLERGASLYLKNKFGRSPLDYSDLTILSSCFDSFIKATNTRSVFHEKYATILDYRPLLNDTKESNCTIHCKHVSEVAIEISRNSRLEGLLMHPLMTSYVQIRRKQNTNAYSLLLAFQYLYWAWFLLTIMTTYNFTHKYAVVVWPFVILYTCRLLMFVVQTLANLKNWITSTHCITDCLLLPVTAFLFISADFISRKYCSIFALLLSTYSMLSWAEYQDHFSLYLITLRRVSVKFVFVLILFSSAIFTFALCFYQLFSIHWNLEESAQQNGTFDELGQAIFKTFIMMTGEYDAGSIPLESSGFVSYLVFLLFVVVISVLFMNILIGYTVGDMMELKNKCKIQKRRNIIDLILLINRMELFLKRFHVKGDLHQGVLCGNPTRTASDSCDYTHKNEYTVKFYPNQQMKVRNHKKCAIAKVEFDSHFMEATRSVLLSNETNTKLEC